MIAPESMNTERQSLDATGPRVYAVWASAIFEPRADELTSQRLALDILHVLSEDAR